MDIRLTLVALSAVVGFGIMGSNVANAGRYTDHSVLRHQSQTMSNPAIQTRSTMMPYAGRYTDRPRHPEFNRDVEAEFAVMDVGEEVGTSRSSHVAHPYGGRYTDHVRTID